jgi:glycerate dehydrogenase
MEHIVFLDRSTLRADIRRPVFPHRWEEYPDSATAELPARLRDATIAVSNKVPLLRDTLSALERLKLIAVCATGTNNVDIDYCRERGIAVCNIRHYAVHSVPEHVFSLILALRRRLLEYDREVRAGAWQRSDQFCLLTHEIRDLHGATLGVIGYGELGQAVARLAQAFGMRVLIAERKGIAQPRPGRVPFEQVLGASDVVTLHVPLAAETRDLLGANELALLRRDALLINTARGGLVNETALAAALRAGRLGGAAVDVLTEEPPARGNPLLAADIPNLLVTPHVAWTSREAMQTLADRLIDNIEAYVRGERKNRVV